MSEYIVDFPSDDPDLQSTAVPVHLPLSRFIREYLFHESSAVQRAGERIRLRDEVQHLIFLLYFLESAAPAFTQEHLIPGELIQPEHISDLPADEIEQNGIGRIDLRDQYAILYFTGEEAEHFSAVGIRWMPVI